MKYKMTIPKPCSEHWDAMDEVERGKYCSVCEKVVVDFSTANKQDIITYIRSGEKICGRFPKRFLDTTLEEDKVKAPSKGYGLVATVVNLLAWTTVATVAISCQTKNEQKTSVEEVVSTKSPEVVYVGPLTIKGKISSELEEIDKVKITLQGHNLSTSTNSKGEFELEIPHQVKKAGEVLVLDFPAGATEVNIGDITNFLLIDVTYAVNTDGWNEEDLVLGEPALEIIATVK
ncbi:MAG: hypothetical protein LBE34_05255 [Flavobacteriaceae bacterium]|nr:hypothetical protein [Flavobacteriaceae bacterium]